MDFNEEKPSGNVRPLTEQEKNDMEVFQRPDFGVPAPSEQPTTIRTEEPAPVPMPPTPEAGVEQRTHGRLVEDVVELMAGVYRARRKGNPDPKQLEKIRSVYMGNTDQQLHAAIDRLLTELKALE